jgi:serine/threonine protein kinase
MNRERGATIDKIEKSGGLEKEWTIPLYLVDLVDTKINKTSDFVYKDHGGDEYGVKIIDRDNPKYQLVHPDMVSLGSGGGGVVGIAYQEGFIKGGVDIPSRIFAAKRVFGNGEFFLTVIKEAQALARLEHPYIAKVYNLASDERERLFMIYEYLGGGSLTNYEYEFEPQFVHKVSYQIGSAIAFIHKMGKIHGDIKPGNFVFKEKVESCENVVLKLLDFGNMATVREDGTATKPEAATWDWVAPEISNNFPWTTRADVFTYAQLLSQMLLEDISYDAHGLTYRELVENLREAQVRQSFPGIRMSGYLTQRIKSILEKGLDPRLNRRYPSIPAIYDDLNNFFTLSGLPDLYPKLLV